MTNSDELVKSACVQKLKNIHRHFQCDSQVNAAVVLKAEELKERVAVARKSSGENIQVRQSATSLLWLYSCLSPTPACTPIDLVI